MSAPTYEFCDFRLDPGHRRLEGPDGVVALTGKPFDALLFLVENAGRPVSRKALVKAVWRDTVVVDNNLTQAISVLRGALGKGHILTLSGRGYQFVSDVRAADPDSRAADLAAGTGERVPAGPADARVPRRAARVAGSRLQPQRSASSRSASWFSSATAPSLAATAP